MQAILQYYSNHAAHSQKTIDRENEIELFEEYYSLNNELRYCNGSHYMFVDSELDAKYQAWLRSDDYASKSFRLYYGNGIVD